MMWIIVLAYLVCSFLAWGLTLGNFTRQFPWGRHVGIATITAIVGPIGLIVALMASLSDGAWLLRPYSTERRWQEFEAEYGPTLDREYFNEHYARRVTSDFKILK